MCLPQQAAVPHPSSGVHQGETKPHNQRESSGLQGQNSRCRFWGHGAAGAETAQQTPCPSGRGEVAEGRWDASTRYTYWVHQSEGGRPCPRHLAWGDGVRPPPAITGSADVEGHLKCTTVGGEAASVSPCSRPPAHVFLRLFGWMTGHMGCTCCYTGGGPEEEAWMAPGTR